MKQGGIDDNRALREMGIFKCLDKQWKLRKISQPHPTTRAGSEQMIKDIGKAGLFT